MKILTIEITIPDSITRVWEAWTTEKGIRTFFARECLIDLRVNGKYEIYFHPSKQKGERGAEGTHILAIQPNNFLSFTWNNPTSLPEIRWQYTHISLYFEAINENLTKLSLEQDGWGKGKAWEQAYLYFNEAWSEVVFPRLIRSFIEGPIDWDVELS
jgi:uncharacterized protein YndB with AHSA1/START domain